MPQQILPRCQTTTCAFFPWLSGRGRSRTMINQDWRSEDSIIPLIQAPNNRLSDLRWKAEQRALSWWRRILRRGRFSRTPLKTSGRQMVVYLWSTLSPSVNLCGMQQAHNFLKPRWSCRIDCCRVNAQARLNFIVSGAFRKLRTVCSFAWPLRQDDLLGTRRRALFGHAWIHSLLRWCCIARSRAKSLNALFWCERLKVVKNHWPKMFTLIFYWGSQL